MYMDKVELNELLEFQVNRNIINLYKSFLVMIEDIQDQHHRSFRKLKKALPESIDLIDQADYLDEERLEYIRKKILDQGNNSLREILGQIEQFNLTSK